MANPTFPKEEPVPSRIAVRKVKDLWPEPLDTPGYIPRHMKRSVTATFPILEVIQRMLYRLRSTTRGADIEKVLALIGLYQAVRPVYHHLTAFLRWALTVQITIPETDPIAKEVLDWMGSEVILDKRARSAILVTKCAQDINDFHPRRMIIPPSIVGVERMDDEVVCLPPIGTRLFWIGFRPFIFSRRGGRSFRHHTYGAGSVVDDNGHMQNSLTLMTLGWSLKPLQAFTALCHQFKLDNLTGTTTVYFAGGAHGDPYGEGWRSVSKAIRKLDTIDMDESVKSDLIKDAEYYYSEPSRHFFADCGIPYRRGYLFYGPPGTGKSSFSAALAGHLGCDIYHIYLNGDITDTSLHRLFLALPRKCIVVIEDIDSAGIEREQDQDLGSPPTPDFFYNPAASQPLSDDEKPRKVKKRRRNRVTLSGLLNAIDGNASQEGRLLVMTSNNPDALDAALTRPGRIDKKVYFGNMSKAAGESIFKRLIGRSALAHDTAMTIERIDQYANEFADKVPTNTFTPAQVQNFLQNCRGDPEKALGEIDAWAKVNHPDNVRSRPSRTGGSSESLTERSADVDPTQTPLDNEKFNLVQPLEEV